MKKSSFVAMILGSIGGILSALGMVMVLVPEYDAFNLGIIMGVIGLIVLVVTIFIWRKMSGKTPIQLNFKTISQLLLGIVSALLLGLGMTMTMVWSHMIAGVIVGVLGIIGILSLVAMIKGIE